MALLIVTLNSF